MRKPEVHKQLFIIPVLLLLVIACRVTALPALPTSSPQSTETLAPLPTLTPLPSATPTPTPLPEVRIDQADWALFTGDYERALEAYQLAFLQASSDETRAASLVGMAHTYILLENYALALDALQTVLDVYPEGAHIPETYYFFGRANQALENYNEAAYYWEGYLQANPGVLNDFIHEQRGDALRAAADYSGAIAAYQSAIDAALAGERIDVEIKQARTYADMGDLETAIRLYSEILEKSDNDYIKAQMNFLSGQAYLQLGLNEQAYSRFQNSVENYPLAYDTYSGMEALIAAGQPVGSLDKGLVYYFAGQYGLAAETFREHIRQDPEHDGTAHHYLAFSLVVLGDLEEAIDEWQTLIDDHPGDRFWAQAWDEMAYTLWAQLDRYDQAAQTYLDFVSRAPNAEEAPQYLYWAARLYEINQKLDLAAQTWERMVVEYPASDLSYRGLFLAGICYYRLGDNARAQTVFQQLILLSPDTETLSAAHLWVGKIQARQGDNLAARTSWEQAANLDPTGYYSERAGELLEGKSPLQIDPDSYSLVVDLEKERNLAEAWLRSVFAIPDEINLSSTGPLSENIHFRRGTAFLEIGLFEEAGEAFDQVRVEIAQDPVNNFRLLNFLLDAGYYRHAILISRQILDLAHFDDASTLLAPIYFNRIRFGTYFSELIVPAANEIGLDPLVLFSLVRQESFFEWYAGSSAGARGLMQLIPSTGQEVASSLNWPPDYSAEDLERAFVNIRLGTEYLNQQFNRFGSGNLYVALAAYNGGPSNARNWYSIAGDDPDLFLEVVRFAETRNYILYISEAVHLYQRVYSGELGE